MEHLSFARKYRPKNFDEIIGQSHIVSTLKNAITSNRVAHAYLFAGPHGVGKTTMARVLAKSLNCIKGPTLSPCDKCPSCMDINGSKSLDVIEIDGASNRGIDEIRTLRENVKFAPTSGQYKIYIIDEVHQITPQGFNALLKTLEEPPMHVKFIFATTNPEKVLPTILSRCQRFDFKKINVKETVGVLKEISKFEKIDITEDALYQIARSSNGGLRDAEVTLDQLASITEDKIKLENVNEVLGSLSSDTLLKITESISAKKPSDVIAIINKVIEDGKDPSIIVSELINHFRNILVAKTTTNPLELIDLPEETVKDLQKISQNFGVEELLYIIYTLIGAYNIIKRIDISKILLEVTLIKLAFMQKPIPFDKLMEKVEEAAKILSTSGEIKINKTNYTQVQEKKIINLNTVTNPKPVISPDETKNKDSKATGIDNSDTKDNSFGLSKDFLNTLNNFSTKTLETEEISSPVEEVGDDTAASYDLPKILIVWPVFLSKLRSVKVSLASFLEYAQPIKIEGKTLTIAFDTTDNFHREVAELAPNANLIKKIFYDILKINFKINFINVDLPNKKTQDQYFQDENNEEADLSGLNQTLENSDDLNKTDSEPDDKNSDNEIVKNAINLFKGKIINNNN